MEEGYPEFSFPKQIKLLSILKGVFAKNERGYSLNAIKKALLINTNLTVTHHAKMTMSDSHLKPLSDQ